MQSYSKLMEQMESVLGVSNPANSVRLEIASLRQKQEESLEEFARRTQKLVNSGYQESLTETVNHVAKDAFVKGVKDKAALNVALNRNPLTMDEVHEYMREAVHNSRVAFGGTKPAIRNVSFDGLSSEEEEYCVRRVYEAGSKTRTSAKATSKIDDRLDTILDLLMKGLKVG